MPLNYKSSYGKTRIIPIETSPHKLQKHTHTHSCHQLFELHCQVVTVKHTYVLSITNSNKIYFIRNKIKYCFRLPMLRSNKFLAWSIKLKTSYGILSSLKLTTLYLICNCQISPISVLFLYFKLLCCLGIFVVLLPLIRLFQHLENVYFIFQMFSGTFGENRSLKWIHVICHTRDIPQNEKLAK